MRLSEISPPETVRIALTTLLLVVIGMVSVPSASAEADPRQWLSDMNEAFSSVSYDGVFSFFSGSELASLRIVHMVRDGVQHERLIHQNGAPREIVRRGEEVVCILMPGDDLLSLESNLPAGPFARSFVRRYDAISRYYELRFFGEDRIAGRSATRVAITPLDNNRFGYRLWLDRQTRLLLKSELVDADGRALEIFQFNSLIIGDEVDPLALEPEGVDKVAKVSNFVLDTEPSISVTGAAPWVPDWLPEGFTLTSTHTRTTMSEEKSVNTMMFSDGLAAFSVFIEDMPPAGAADMASRNGATVAVTHLTEGPEEMPYLVTLVGELPTGTAKRIARSIRLQ